MGEGERRGERKGREWRKIHSLMKTIKEIYLSKIIYASRKWKHGLEISKYSGVPGTGA